MITIQLNDNAIQALKDFGIFIEVELVERSSPAPKVSQPTPPLYPNVVANIPIPQMTLVPISEPTTRTATQTEVIGKVGHTDVDAKGAAWDANIHSSSKNCNKDGTWRTKRNLDPAILAAAKGQKVETVVSTVEYIPQSPYVSPMEFVRKSPPKTVAQEENTYTQSDSHAHTFQSFKTNLIEVFAALIKEGKIDQAYVDQLKKYFEIKEIWNLWASEKKLYELFENFCGANLIQRIEG